MIPGSNPGGPTISHKYLHPARKVDFDSKFKVVSSRIENEALNLRTQESFLQISTVIRGFRGWIQDKSLEFISMGHTQRSSALLVGEICNQVVLKRWMDHR